MISNPNFPSFLNKTDGDPGFLSDENQSPLYYGSPTTTNLSQSLEASALSSPDQICPLLFFEETEPQDLDLICLLSPNSKASALLSKCKRIQKKPAQSKEASKPSKKGPSQSGRKRNMWSESEDQKLLHFMSIYGTRWAKIASHIPDRTGKQVRDRYLSVLVANINKEPWTEEEDRVILEKLEEIGPQWCRISDCFEGRTDIQVKNRYYTYLKKHGIGKDSEGNNEDEAEIKDPQQELDPAYMISYQIENPMESEDSFFCWKGLGFNI